MRTKALIPDAAVVQLEELLADERGITMVVSTTGEQACCPSYGEFSCRLPLISHRAWRGDIARTGGGGGG